MNMGDFQMKSLAYKNVLATVFYLMILLLGWLVKGDFHDMKSSIKELTTSVQELNITMAEVVTTQKNDGKRIDKLEKLHEPR